MQVNVRIVVTCLAGAVGLLASAVPGAAATDVDAWRQGTGPAGAIEGRGLAAGTTGDGAFERLLPRSDFNGDGFADLAVGVPGEDLGLVADAGAVNVLYGSANGVAAGGSQFWSQDSAGVPGGAEVGDGLGGALSSGDLNGDGYADLAVGVPGEFLGPIPYAGAVVVLHGSPAGLTAQGAQFWSQDSAGIRGGAEDFDGFGADVTVGDFDDDGHGDLAVGVPGEDLGALEAGATNVLYGGTHGLTGAGDQFWSQDSPGVKGGAYSDLEDFEDFEDFGAELVAGDLTGDGVDDLVVGVPHDNVAFVEDAGSVHVLPGSAGGLTATGDTLWNQDTPGVKGEAELRTGIDFEPIPESFGGALAVADYNRDGQHDLAVGVPGEAVTDAFTCEVNYSRDCADGAVQVLFGGVGGPSAVGDQYWPGTEYSDEGFGRSLAGADLNGDGFAELAASSYLRTTVFPGSSGGPTTAGMTAYEPSAQLMIRSMGRSEHLDLVLGQPGGEQVQVLYNTASGPDSDSAQVWSQNSPGVLGGTQTDDRFGSVLVD